MEARLGDEGGLIQGQLQQLVEAVRERMELLSGGSDSGAIAPGGCFRQVELTSNERASKGLSELPSALELETVAVLEGDDAEAAARDADAEDLRRWLESRPTDLLSHLRVPHGATAPSSNIHTVPTPESPAFEQPGSPCVSEMESTSATNVEFDLVFSEMHATVAAIAARLKDLSSPNRRELPEIDGTTVTQRDEQRNQSGVGTAGERDLAFLLPQHSDIAEPPDWRHVDPHPHLSLDLGLDSISPDADWREFLTPQEGPSEQQIIEAQRRLLPPPLPFVDEQDYEEEVADNSRNWCEVGTSSDEARKRVLVPSGASVQLCTECFDCPCACSGAELGGGLRSASLCLVCCDVNGCSCDDLFKCPRNHEFSR